MGGMEVLMSGNVVGLRVAGPEPVAEVVEALEFWLELALSGELRTIAMCGNCTSTQVRIFTSQSGDRMLELGGAQLLVSRISQALLDDMRYA